MDIHPLLQAIRDNIAKIMIGKQHVVDLLLIALLSRGHVLIEDVPGVGKTTLAQAFARSLNLSYNRIQFTPDVLPSDITGFNLFSLQHGNMEFIPGAIMSQIVLADEINRSSPKTQSSLLEVMEERQVTVDGVSRPVPQPFMVLATQNPIEYTGTFPLRKPSSIDLFCGLIWAIQTISKSLPFSNVTAIPRNCLICNRLRIAMTSRICNSEPMTSLFLIRYWSTLPG